MKLPVYELEFDESEGNIITSISVVSTPAINENFFAFNKASQEMFYNQDKQLIIGPALIPNKKLFRNQNGKKFFTFFSSSTIQKIKEHIISNGAIKSNVEHQSDENDNPILEDIVLTEIWVKEGHQDKSSMYGFNHLPVGTLFVCYKVKDLEIWKMIKEGQIKGFSIEGSFKVVPTNIDVNPITALRQEYSDLYTAASNKEKQFLDIVLSSINYELFSSYNNYPQEASDLASKAIKLVEENNLQCATQVGKVRAQQLANKENISIAVIKRTNSYLKRAKEYYNPNDELACGTISYWYWGGEPMLEWTNEFLSNELDMEFIAIKTGETEEEFIQRGMSDDKMISEYPNEEQRLAVLYSLYKQDRSK
jgi:hypothetical protein